MIPLMPVPGYAPGVRALAGAIEETGRRLAAAGQDLVRLRDGAVWDGPAGDAFGARIRAVPTVIDRAAQRHLGAVAALRGYADVLEAEQAVAQRCVSAHDDAWDRFLVLEDRAAALVAIGRDESAPELLVLRALQRDQMAVVADAEARHGGALDRLGVEDRGCSAVLRALADDGLADPLLYRGLRATSATGHGVGALAGMAGHVSPDARLLGAVGEAAGLGADGALLVGYGDGSWGGLAAGAGVAAMGVAGQSLRAGAKAGAVVRTDGAVVAGASLGARERLVAGVASTARSRLEEARRLVDLPAERATASALVGGPAARGRRLAARDVMVLGRRQVRARVDLVRLELASVSAGGRSTQRMYAAGVTLEVAAKGAEQALPDGEEADGRDR